MYGVKYRTSYKRRSNNTTTIDILENGYTGSTITLVADNNAFNISFNGNANNIYEPTIGYGAVLNVIATPLTMLDLFTDDPQQFIVKAYNGNSGENLFWQGFISPEIYNENYSSAIPVPISIQCNDGMQVLGYIPYKTSANTYITGTTILSAIFYNILTKLNISFSNIYTLNDLRIADFTTNYFLYLKLANENFIDESGVAMSCREVLESICGSMGFVMKFKGQNIYIYDPINLHDVSKGKSYTLISTYPYIAYETQITTFGDYVDISGSTLSWYETGVSLDVVPRISDVQVDYDPYNFNEYEYDFNLEDNWTTIGSWINYSTSSSYYTNSGVRYTDWLATGNNLMRGLKENIDDEPIYGFSLTNSGIGNNIAYTFPFSNITQDESLALKITMQVYVCTKENSYNMFASGTSHQIYQTKIPVSVKVGNQYWKGGSQWSSGATGNYIQPLTVREEGISATDYTKSNISDTWTEGVMIIPIKQSTDENLINGYVTITIYDTIKTYFSFQVLPAITYLYMLMVKDVKLELIDVSTGQNIGNDGISTTTVVNENLITKTPFVINTTAGIGTYGASRASYKTDQQVIQGTNITGMVRSTASTGGTYYDTSKLVAESFISQYKKPRLKLSGVLDVQNYMLNIDNKLITDNKNLTDKAFYMVSGTYSDADESMEVEMVELTSTRESLSEL